MSLTTFLNKASNLFGLKSPNFGPIAPPLDGEIIFCKNNVCVHPPVTLNKLSEHHPGYMNIRSQEDDVLGRTLILTWIPNSTLKKNPRSIENSPRQGKPPNTQQSNVDDVYHFENNNHNNNDNTSDNVINDNTSDNVINDSDHNNNNISNNWSGRFISERDLHKEDYNNNNNNNNDDYNNNIKSNDNNNVNNNGDNIKVEQLKDNLKNYHSMINSTAGDDGDDVFAISSTDNNNNNANIVNSDMNNKMICINCGDDVSTKRDDVTNVAVLNNINNITDNNNSNDDDDGNNNQASIDSSLPKNPNFHRIKMSEELRKRSSSSSKSVASIEMDGDNIIIVTEEQIEHDVIIVADCDDNGSDNNDDDDDDHDNNNNNICNSTTEAATTTYTPTSTDVINDIVNNENNNSSDNDSNNDNVHHHHNVSVNDVDIKNKASGKLIESDKPPEVGSEVKGHIDGGGMSISVEKTLSSGSLLNKTPSSPISISPLHVKESASSSFSSSSSSSPTSGPDSIPSSPHSLESNFFNPFNFSKLPKHQFKLLKKQKEEELRLQQQQQLAAAEHQAVAASSTLDQHIQKPTSTSSTTTAITSSTTTSASTSTSATTTPTKKPKHFITKHRMNFPENSISFITVPDDDHHADDDNNHKKDDSDNGYHGDNDNNNNNDDDDDDEDTCDVDSFVDVTLKDVDDDDDNNDDDDHVDLSFVCGVFSVDLGQMRSLRIFYNNSSCNSGQLVIASRDSQYKILHFHHGGLDRLVDTFKEWSFLAQPSRRGMEKDDSSHYFSIIRPYLPHEHCHPDEGTMEMVTRETWKVHMNDLGVINDHVHLRKAVFFAGIEPSIRAEVWPFLLHYYPYLSTYEDRECIRNDKYIEYLSIRKVRERMSREERENFWKVTQCIVEKDVVRTDRSHPYFSGEDNPNVDVLKNILLNYAVTHPTQGYTQGMSDLLAPILIELKNESDAYWCFVGLMRDTVFFSSPTDVDMDGQLLFLRELLRLLLPSFYQHLLKMPDGLDLLFCHRWLLLCFKREFSERDALKIWEVCWARYLTDYFHIFVVVAVLSIYGQDVVDQDLPSDDLLLHFNSLSMHMNADMVLKKARGLLHEFCQFEVIPCTLHGLCSASCSGTMWENRYTAKVQCVGHNLNQICPASATAGKI